MDDRVQVRAGGAAAGAGTAWVTSSGMVSGVDPAEEGRATQKAPPGEDAQGERGGGEGPAVTASALGALQVRDTASPGEGGRGSATIAAPTKKGHEAASKAGAPGSGAPAAAVRGGSGESAGMEHPSDRVRHEKGGGVVEGVGEVLGVVVGDGVPDAVLLRDADGLPESETVPLEVAVAVQDGVAVGDGVVVGVWESEAPRDAVRVPVPEDEQVDGEVRPSAVQADTQGQGRQAEREAPRVVGL